MPSFQSRIGDGGSGIPRIVMSKNPAVYFMATNKNGTIYIGVTSDLIRRIWEHKANIVVGFTSKYGIKRLVWYELHESMESAIQREKQLKNWKRQWKIDLIENVNPDWRDLYSDLF